MVKGCTRGGGHPQGAPLRDGKGVHTRAEGTHKGRPYEMVKGCTRGGGRPQGAPLRDGKGGHTRAEGTHKGRPYEMVKGCTRGGGHPQGAPLRMMDKGCIRGGRAPTRGTPTRFRQPHEVFSNLMQLPCTKGQERNLCKGMNWGVGEGAGGKTFWGGRGRMWWRTGGSGGKGGDFVGGGPVFVTF